MPVIDVKHVTKAYQISKSDLAAESLARWVKGVLVPWRRREDTFAALSDVSFEVDAGGTFGIIGRNGSGKSTMLKLLARVTLPTRGTVRVRGRIGPLIEVGAGFHPELTGLENIYVNGTIMGMTRREITRKLEAIVEFAELRRFLHTPIKRYSSGMYIRLGFSVAVHSEPDILLVDEILSVGDAAFQRKSLDKILELGRQGTTVVFVSHNLIHLERLCRETLVLNRGHPSYLGDTASAVQHYGRLLAAEGDYAFRSTADGGTRVVEQARLLGAHGAEVQIVRAGDPLTVAIRHAAEGTGEAVMLRVAIFTADGLLCHETDTWAERAGGNGSGWGTTYLRYRAVELAEGDYRVVVTAFRSGEALVGTLFQKVLPLAVVDQAGSRGVVRLDASWERGVAD